MMLAEKAEFPVKMMARVLGVSRSGFYSWLSNGCPRENWSAEREAVRLKTAAFGEVVVKRIRYPSGEARLVPEYEVCKRIAQEKGLALRAVYEAIVRDAVPPTVLPA